MKTLIKLLLCFAVILDFSCHSSKVVVEVKPPTAIDFYSSNKSLIENMEKNANHQNALFLNGLKTVNNQISYYPNSFEGMLSTQTFSDEQFRQYYGLQLKEIPNTNFRVITYELPFKSNKSKITKDDKLKLDTLSNFLINSSKSYGKIVLNFIGYADIIGNKNSNLILSQKRAASVYEYINQNIGNKSGFDIIKPKGLGDDEIGPQKRICRIFVYLINK